MYLHASPEGLVSILVLKGGPKKYELDEINIPYEDKFYGLILCLLDTNFRPTSVWNRNTSCKGYFKPLWRKNNCKCTRTQGDVDRSIFHREATSNRACKGLFESANTRSHQG